MVHALNRAVAFDGRVYEVASGGIVSCLDAATGRVVFRGRLDAPGQYFASPVAAAGRVSFTSLEGMVTVIGAGDALTVLARNDLAEQSAASPAVIGDTIDFRTARHVYAFAAARR